MDSVINAASLVTEMNDILNRIRNQGERFVIERNGEPIAILAPTNIPVSITLHDLAERLGNLPSTDDRFADDLETIQNTQPPAEPRTWDN